MGEQLSGAWATVGHSQGGHAALAGGQFSELADKRIPGMSFKGAVAMAPPSNLRWSLGMFVMPPQLTFSNTGSIQLQRSLGSYVSAPKAAIGGSSTYMEEYENLLTGSIYAAYLVKGSEATNSPMAADQVFGARMLEVYNRKVASECLSDFSTSVAEDIAQYAATPGATPASYTAVKSTALNNPSFIRYVDSNEPGQVRLFGSSLVVTGLADATVLGSASFSLVESMRARGSEVIFNNILDLAATHSGMLSMQQVKDAVISHLSNLFTPS